MATTAKVQSALTRARARTKNMKGRGSTKKMVDAIKPGTKKTEAAPATKKRVMGFGGGRAGGSQSHPGGGAPKKPMHGIAPPKKAVKKAAKKAVSAAKKTVKAAAKTVKAAVKKAPAKRKLKLKTPISQRARDSQLGQGRKKK